jgi:competence protein ComEA
MRSHRSATEHQEAVSRRLALLSAELTAVREEEGSPHEWAAPATHTRVAPGRLGDAAVRPGPTPTRVREEPLTEAEPEPESGPGAPRVPVPGRHARRRPGPLGRGLPGLVAIGPGQLAVVALVVVAGLSATAWWLIRASPTEVPAADAVQEPAPLLTGLPTETAPTAGGEDQAAELVVDVAGKVRRPGIAVLAPGSRVVDALEAAGGARAGVNLSGLNLARQLVDGEQILVGVAPAPGLAAGAAESQAPADGTGPLVPLNTASQTELEALPEVGPVTASAIIAWREEHGGFTAVDELLEVDGIGDATLAQLAPLVTL